MAQIPPIDDSYIDEIIKAAEAYNPALNKTQGVKLRELIKKLRDRFEQENSTINALLTGVETVLDGKINIAEKGANNGVATLGADGKLVASQTPAIAISETFIVSSQPAMLAITGAEQGDVAVRTDISKSFILQQTPTSTLSNWQELLTPMSPVQSVNGQVGIVTLTETLQSVTERGSSTTNGASFGGDVIVNNTINGETSFSVINASPGTGAYAISQVSNGASALQMFQIGTNNPTSGMYKTDGSLLFGTGANGLTLAGNSLSFYASGAEAMRILPDRNIELANNLRLYNPSSAAGLKTQSITLDGYYKGALISASIDPYLASGSNLKLQTYSNDNTLGTGITITRTDLVGIGTSIPTGKLTVEGGESMVGGWNRAATIRAINPVLEMYSTGGNDNHAGIGYDGEGMYFWLGSDAGVTTRPNVFNIQHTGAVNAIGNITAPRFIGLADEATYGTYLKNAALNSYILPAQTNTGNTLVERDGSGNFAAGTITAALNGNATSATNWGGRPADLGAVASTIGIGLTIDPIDGAVRYSTLAQNQAWLGLGSAAYQPSSAFQIPLTLTTMGSGAASFDGVTLNIPPNSGSADVESGSYLPQANIISGADEIYPATALYTRIGNIVNVTGSVDLHAEQGTYEMTINLSIFGVDATLLTGTAAVYGHNLSAGIVLVSQGFAGLQIVFPSPTVDAFIYTVCYSYSYHNLPPV